MFLYKVDNFYYLWLINLFFFDLYLVDISFYGFFGIVVVVLYGIRDGWGDFWFCC